MNLEEFIEEIRHEGEYQRYWFMTLTCFRRGQIVFYTTNLKDRLGSLYNEIKYDVHPYPKGLYEFIRDNDANISLLMEVQGLELNKFPHELGGSSDYRFLFYVKKIDSIQENKGVKQQSVKPHYGFVLGVISVSTHLGKIFISREQFEKKMVTDPGEICHHEVDRLKLYSIFQIKSESINDVVEKKFLDELSKTINSLIKLGYIHEIKLRGGETYISLSPGAFLWKNTILNSESIVGGLGE